MVSLVISDVHIGSKGCNHKAVYTLLKKTKFDRLILVGDIIDGWLFKKYKKFSPQHTKLIRLLLKISKDKKIIWISGNHDEFLRKYTPFDFGNIEIVDEFIENGIWFCHGDLFDGVVKLRWLGMLGSIGYDFAIVIDRFFKKMGYQKSLSKYLKDNVKAAVSFMTDFENEMARQCSRRACHTVVCGHIHKPSDKTIKDVRYINTGDWIENRSYLIYSQEDETLPEVYLTLHET
jgi:UDP-2,3-diacylglucosamine pyrophosphatase LpxH